MNTNNTIDLKSMDPDLVAELARMGLNPTHLKDIREAIEKVNAWERVLEKANRKVADARQRGVRYLDEVTYVSADGSCENVSIQAAVEELMRAV